MNFSKTAAARGVGFKHANLQHAIIFVLLGLLKRFHLYLFHSPPNPLACTPSSLSFLPSPPSCLFPHLDSPLSFLFHALSDMSQGSSDEDSEEEEDFARVQFGSRYTLKHGVSVYVFVCACSVRCMIQWFCEPFH